MNIFYYYNRSTILPLILDISLSLYIGLWRTYKVLSLCLILPDSAVN